MGVSCQKTINKMDKTIIALNLLLKSTSFGESNLKLDSAVFDKYFNDNHTSNDAEQKPTKKYNDNIDNFNANSSEVEDCHLKHDKTMKLRNTKTIFKIALENGKPDKGVHVNNINSEFTHDKDFIKFALKSNINNQSYELGLQTYSLRKLEALNFNTSKHSNGQKLGETWLRFQNDYDYESENYQYLEQEQILNNETSFRYRREANGFVPRIKPLQMIGPNQFIVAQYVNSIGDPHSNITSSYYKPLFTSTAEHKPKTLSERTGNFARYEQNNFDILNQIIHNNSLHFKKLMALTRFHLNYTKPILVKNVSTTTNIKDMKPTAQTKTFKANSKALFTSRNMWINDYFSNNNEEGQHKNVYLNHLPFRHRFKDITRHKSDLHNKDFIRQYLNSSERNKFFNLQNSQFRNEPTNTYRPQQNENQNSSKKLSIFNYNDYVDIPGWYEQEFYSFTNITNVVTTTSKMATTTTATETNWLKENSNTTYQNFTSSTMPPSRPDVVAEARTAMALHHMWYLNGFFYELFKILIEKPDDDTHLLMALKHVVHRLDTAGKLRDMGRPAVTALHHVIHVMISWGPDEFKEKLAEGSRIIHQRKSALTEDMLNITDAMEAGFSIDEGEDLLKTLDDVFDYYHPYYKNISSNAYDVAEKVVAAILKPYYRLQITNKVILDKLFQHINNILITKYKFDARLRGVTNYKENIINKKLGDRVYEKDRFNFKRGRFILNGNTSAYKVHRNNVHITNKQIENKLNNKDYLKEETGTRNERIQYNDLLHHFRAKSGNDNVDNLSGYGTDDTSKEISLKLHNTYKSMKDTGKYENRKSFINEIFNLHKSLRIKPKSADADTNSRVTRTEHADEKQKQKIDDNSRYRKRTTRKLKNKYHRYDRLMQNQYNYENSLRHNIHDQSHELVNPVVSKDSAANTQQFTRKLKTASDVKNGVFSKDPKLLSDLTATNLTLEDKNSDENELYDEQIRNNRIHCEIKPKENFTLVSRRIINDTQNTKGYVKKKPQKLITLIEESSYSDEEKELKVKLSDAIRHDGFVLKRYRKYLENTEFVKEKTRIGERSSYSDEEGIFKNNIYKVFGSFK